MNVLRNERVRLVAVALLLAILLTFLLAQIFGGAVRDIVALPLVYLAWIGRLYLRTIPRALIWGALLLFGLVMALSRALIAQSEGRTRTADVRAAMEAPGGLAGKVGRLASQIRFARRSAYFRQRLAQRLGRLILRATDRGERYGPKQVERALDALDAPPEIRAFFSEGEQGTTPSRRVGPFGWLRRRLRGDDEGPSSASLEQVVQYLEDRLEVL